MKAAENMPNAELAKMLVDEQEKVKKAEEKIYEAMCIIRKVRYYDLDEFLEVLKKALLRK